MTGAVGERTEEDVPGYKTDALDGANGTAAGGGAAEVSLVNKAEGERAKV